MVEFVIINKRENTNYIYKDRNKYFILNNPEDIYMKFLNAFCLTLTIIGAINWGIIGIFDYNVVEGLLGHGTVFSRIVYSLVGLSGLYTITFYGLLGRDD